jgi:hypothetical protein
LDEEVSDMTEQSPQPEQQPQQSEQKTPLKSAAPPNTQSQILQIAITWITTTWIRLRPTTISGLRTIATQAQQWVQQLEIQEKNALQTGESIAPIDWTPIVKLGDRFWTTVKPLWQKIITAARPRLPQSFQPLSDRALSGIFAGTLLLILWFFSALPSGQAAKPPAPETRSPYARTFSQRPPSPRPYDSQPRPIEDLTAPRASNPIASNPIASNPIASNPIASTRPAPPIRSQPVSQPIPQPIAQPIAQPMTYGRSETIATADSSSVEIINPEASRRLKLRQNLDLIANALVDQAIVSIRPNDRSQSLTITLSDAWYRSPEDLQTKLTNSLLVIAQGQGFSRLQLEDTEGTIVARNAVVGEGMLVVQRSR